jgi:hypothetical protein
MGVTVTKYSRKYEGRGRLPHCGALSRHDRPLVDFDAAVEAAMRRPGLAVDLESSGIEILG